MGDAGTLLRSADHGISWEALASGTTKPLTSAWADGDNIVVVGGAQFSGLSLVILHSTDGGDSWSVALNFDAPISRTLTDVYGIGTDVVAVGGRTDLSGSQNWTAYYSSDGGATWTFANQNTGSTDRMHSVWGSGTTFIGVGNSRTVYRSTDSGANWDRVAIFGSHRDEYRDVWAVGSDVIAIGDSGKAAYSSDLGATWTEVNAASVPLKSLYFDGLDAVAVGNNGTIVSSIDKGQTWVSRGIGQAGSYAGVAGGGGSFVAAGSAASFAYSNDFGASWSAVDSGVTSDLRAVCASGDWRVVAGGRVNFDGAIAQSYDGGRTFEAVELDPSHRFFEYLWCDGDRAVATGQDALAYVTDDRGVSWTPVTIDSSFWPGPVAGMDQIVFVGTSGGIQRSADGGFTFQDIADSPTWVDEIWYDGITALTIGTAATVGRSTDDGVTWTDVITGSTDDFFTLIAKGSIAIAAGDNGAIWRSTDAGATWTSVGPGPEDLVSGWTDGNVYLLGGALGAVLRSDDDGATWVAGATGGGASVRAFDGDGARLLLSDDAGDIYQSADAGTTWVRATHYNPTPSGAALFGLTGLAQGDPIGVAAYGTVLVFGAE
jgi:photosystem II stability/assembly factor-like uncharacterized protein